MSREQLPITSIFVKDRQRLDYGDLDDLAESMRAYGLIQPVIVNQEGQLIAGGRRLAAATRLGWHTIDVCRRETLSDDELHVLELEENIRRKDETWQERCLHIAHIHQLKQSIAALDGDTWSQKATGEMLGMSDANVNFNLQIARLLKAELDENKKPKAGARFWACDSFSNAWRLRLRDMEDAVAAANSEIVRQQFAFTPQDGPPTSFLTQETNELAGIITEDIDLATARQRYESNPLNTEPFDVYWQQKQALDATRDSHRNTIYLSQRFIHADSIVYMTAAENAGRFDHIITDIPYGIDIDYINQQHPRGGMNDLDIIEDLHDVDYNKQLIADFFPAAFQCTKDHAFVITWCDIMLWQYMYDLATKFGFRVQRWPITWVKSYNPLNQCAQYNFTKSTEIAIVCRKPGAMLRCHQPTCVVTAGKDDLQDQINHPFAKPELTWRYLIDAVSLEGQTILEPFAGRGSGVISMMRMNRHVIAVEKDEVHYNHLLENVKQHYFLPLNPNFIFK